MSVLPIKEKEGPFCQCLYDMENGLRASQHCFTTCSDQFEIIAERQKLLKDVDVLVKKLENAIKNNEEVAIARKPEGLSIKELLEHII